MIASRIFRIALAAAIFALSGHATPAAAQGAQGTVAKPDALPQADRQIDSADREVGAPWP